MELKLAHESICINEIVFDGILEQSIELDYLLPDYCQSIFKVLKCKIIPKITSERIMNGKLLVDGVAYIKIIYVSEENYRIRTITQKQIFSKSIELKNDYSDGVINTHVKCDYVNCRVVNQRRLDIRGAITIKATVSAVRQLDILSNALGMGVQINNQKVTTLDKKLSANKDFSVKEELELGYGKPLMNNMLEYSANGVLTDYKLIANKVIIKGEINLHTLYDTDENTSSLEIMDYTVPISQIVDLPGVNEDYKCMVAFDVTSIDINMKQNGDAGSNGFEAEFGIRVNCEANKNAETMLINDIYSTSHNLQTNLTKIKIEQLLNVVNENCICKNSVKIPQGELNCVYDIVCDFSNENCKFDNGSIIVMGNLSISILALDCENMPIMIDKTIPCELKLETKCNDTNVMFNPNITIASISYNLIANDELEVRVELKISGNLYKHNYYNVINSIDCDENSRKQRMDDAVLRLYFYNQSEKVWDIAKKYNSSVEAIMTENNLDSDQLNNKGMLLIPIID